ncbi:hypothetical protein PF005_g18378 [Phytophthora fragariae]|uniref:Transmembrane protein 198 n=1 Tax=Phytophthora fragariae TaxID=53985 RepID=A0A6A3JHF8_9STRA|nr:hypothetical protein PF003_g7136 [Phytophthora fragariae]KAE8930527.1 hypothetical protein PF009_g19390 [Phytophthora fragariae]KAE8993157.1 hypothetical protein PF011_g17250 [Phytophthora fragariae]KAE9078355.1 hypothetical protein PF010_g23152 [Phytophthora fragariae]KAE9078485.1 hypothetical protein PF007_g23844 [Phytophthora fragariae]
MRLSIAALVLATGISGAYGHSYSPGYFPDHLHIEPGVVAESAIIVGLVVCLYGFRLLRAMVFVCGFLVCGLLAASALENTFGLKAWVLVASWIGFIIVGIAGGCVVLAFFPLGVFLVGAMLAYAFTSSLPYRMVPGKSSAVLDGAVVLLGGLLSWLLVRPFAIVASSLVGSLTTVWGIGYFAGKYPSSDELERFRSHTDRSGRFWLFAVPGIWWMYLSAMLVLFVLGMVKQCRDVGRTRNSSHIGLYTGWRSSPNTLIP